METKEIEARRVFNGWLFKTIRNSGMVQEHIIENDEEAIAFFTELVNRD